MKWLEALLVAALIFFHRRLTRKAGHYAGRTTIRDQSGNVTSRKSTFLQTFLLISVPFTLAHGLLRAR